MPSSTTALLFALALPALASSAFAPSSLITPGGSQLRRSAAHPGLTALRCQTADQPANRPLHSRRSVLQGFAGAAIATFTAHPAYAAALPGETVLVVGARGSIGEAVVDELLQQGVKVRALTRDPALAASQGKIEWVAGDLNDPNTISPATMAGVTRVIYCPGTRRFPPETRAFARTSCPV